MSKLRAPSSLRQPTTMGSRLRPPSTDMKRQISDPEISSPAKRARRGSSGGSNSDEAMKPPMKRGPAPQTRTRPGLQKSMSVANLATAGAKRTTGRSTLAASRLGASTINLTGRPSNVTAGYTGRPSNISAGQTTRGRTPGANITNRINNSRSTLPASKPNPTATDPPKGKPKRAAWDLKGRLQDMEAQVGTFKHERESFNNLLENYNTRIESLEQEKQSLNQNLELTQSAKLENQAELDRLLAELKAERSERTEEKRKLEARIGELESAKRVLEEKLRTAELNLGSREEENSSLRLTISQMTSRNAGMEAQLTSTQISLQEQNKNVSNLESLVSELRETVQGLESELTSAHTLRKKLHNQIQELKGNIRVFCRVRPLLGDEIKRNGDSDVIHHINILDDRSLEVLKSADPNSSSMSGLKGRGNGTFEFAYDRVFTPASSQGEVFEEISQLVQSALDGYNVCVFAYGQTGSGKTFTMEGVHEDSDLEGMIPRTVRLIFQQIEELSDKGWEYKIEASILEIYNENIRDLLASQKEAKNTVYDIKLLDNKKSDTYVTNLKVIEVKNESQVQALLKSAQQHRAVGSTNMNERSSRSHSVFRLKLIGENSKTSECCEGMLNLVDLAGSERLKESGSEGLRLTETQNINKSLSNLGNVIMALGQKASHIPYRNSKLTHLLQSSLGGNSKTLMFVNVSPLEMCFGETLNSLRFATKVNQCHIGTATKQVRK